MRFFKIIIMIIAAAKKKLVKEARKETNQSNVVDMVRESCRLCVQC